MKKSKKALVLGIILLLFLSIILLWGCTRGSVGEVEIEPGEGIISEEPSLDEKEIPDLEEETDVEDHEADEKEEPSGEEEAEDRETGESGGEDSNEPEVPEEAEEEVIEEETEQEAGEDTEEDRNKDFAEDPSNWVHFSESNFQRLLEGTGSSKNHLTYQDFYQGITYQLMIGEEKVREIFGEPINKVNDSTAYHMRTLEYDGMEVHLDDHGFGYIASTFFIQTSDIPGPRDTRVGDTAAEILLAYPLPEKDQYFLRDGQVSWGEQSESYAAYMATINYLADGEIAELRFVEKGGYAAAVYQIQKGKVDSIHFFEMN